MSRVDNSHYLLQAAAARHRNTTTGPTRRSNSWTDKASRSPSPPSPPLPTCPEPGSTAKTTSDSSSPASAPTTATEPELPPPSGQATLHYASGSTQPDTRSLTFAHANAELRQRLEHHLGEQRARRNSGVP